MPHETCSMSQCHISIALYLLSLVAGALLLSKAKTEEAFCKTGAKILGIAVMAISLLSLLCIGYNSLRSSTCHREGPSEAMGWHHPPLDMPMDAMDKAPETPKKEPK